MAGRRFQRSETVAEPLALLSDLRATRAMLLHTCATLRPAGATYLALAAVGDYELIESEGPDGILVVVAVPSDLPERYRSGFEEIRPILEASGMVAGQDFCLVFSPERIDPGNHQFGPRNTPKVVTRKTRTSFSRSSSTPLRRLARPETSPASGGVFESVAL